MSKKAITQSTVATNNIQSQPDQVKSQAAALKLAFDQYGIDSKTYNNTVLIAELADESLGNSGSNTIGHNSTTVTADNVGDALEENAQAISGVVLGQIPDNTLTEAKMAADMKKQAGGVAEFDTIANSFTANADRYAGNIKTADSFQDETLWTQVLGLQSSDTTNFKIGNQSIKIEENDNVASTLSSQMRNISLDYTKLSNGESSGNEDYVNVIFYVSNASFIDPSLGIRVGFSQVTPFDGGNAKAYSITSGISTGWNYVKIKKSDFFTGGSGAWDGIQSIELRWTSLINAQNEYVSFQLIQLIKKDPSLDAPNPFQYMGVKEFTINTGEWFVGEEYGKNVIKQLQSISDDNNSLNGLKLYANFIASAQIKSINNSFSPSLGWRIDSSNRVFLLNTGDTLSLNIITSGSLVTKTETMPITSGDTLRYELDRKGVKLIANGYVNGKLVASIESNITFTNEGFITLGLLGSSIQSYIISTSITEIAHAHHADVAETSNDKPLTFLNNTLTSASWVDDTGTSGYWIYDVTLPVLETHIPGFGVHLVDLNNASAMLNTIESFNGYVRFYAFGQPGSDIDVDIKVVR